MAKSQALNLRIILSFHYDPRTTRQPTTRHGDVRHLGVFSERQKESACFTTHVSPQSASHHRLERKRNFEGCIVGSLHLIQDYCLVLSDVARSKTERFGCLITHISKVVDHLSISHLVLRLRVPLGRSSSTKSTAFDHNVFLWCQKLQAEAHHYLLEQYVHIACPRSTWNTDTL